MGTGRQHSNKSLFLIHSDNLYLLIGAFRPLIFKVITDIIGLIVTTLAVVLYLVPLFFVPIFCLLLFLPFVVFIQHFI